MDIGFVPTNAAWKEPTGNLGLFYYHQADFVHANKYRDGFHTGCKRYSDEFESTYIDADRTFKIARVMGMISCASSIFAMVAATVFVITPCSMFYYWARLLLSTALISFIAEGSKFLLFKTAVCRSPLWIPGGSFLTPETAESCDMGDTAYYSIAAGVVQLIVFCFVCLFALHQRELDPDYGTDDDDEDKDTTNVNEDHDDQLEMGVPHESTSPSANLNEDGDDELEMGEAPPEPTSGMDCIAETIQTANDLVCSPTNGATDEKPILCSFS